MGSEVAVGAGGDGVHGAGAVVVGGQDGVQRVGGGVFGAAVDLVVACVGAVVVLVGFVGDSRVDGEVVFVAAAGHADVGHGAAGAIGQDGPADPGVVASPMVMPWADATVPA